MPGVWDGGSDCQARTARALAEGAQGLLHHNLQMLTRGQWGSPGRVEAKAFLEAGVPGVLGQCEEEASCRREPGSTTRPRGCAAEPARVRARGALPAWPRPGGGPTPPTAPARGGREPRSDVPPGDGCPAMAGWNGPSSSGISAQTTCQCREPECGCGVWGPGAVCTPGPSARPDEFILEPAGEGSKGRWGQWGPRAQSRRGRAAARTVHTPREEILGAARAPSA